MSKAPSPYTLTRDLNNYCWWAWHHATMGGHIRDLPFTFKDDELDFELGTGILTTDLHRDGPHPTTRWMKDTQ